jgi:hypothetical protein
VPVLGVLKLLLAVGLLLAHAPVCKLDAARAVSQLPDAAAKPPCCQKCKAKPAPPKPDKPTKPTCPPDCQLCSAPTAALTVTAPETGLDLSVVDRLPATSPPAVPDGFHSLLDRPPRA